MERVEEQYGTVTGGPASQHCWHSRTPSWLPQGFAIRYALVQESLWIHLGTGGDQQYEPFDRDVMLGLRGDETRLVWVAIQRASAKLGCHLLNYAGALDGVPALNVVWSFPFEPVDESPLVIDLSLPVAEGVAPHRYPSEGPGGEVLFEWDTQDRLHRLQLLGARRLLLGRPQASQGPPDAPPPVE